MAEFLIRVVDKVNAEDFYRDCQCLKRGDVVWAADDGWPWSREELVAPYWRVIKVPALPLSEAQAFLASEKDSDPAHPSRTLQRRAFKLDLDALTSIGPLATYLADDTRTQPFFTVSGAARLSAFRAAKVLKAPIADPNVITP